MDKDIVRRDIDKTRATQSVSRDGLNWLETESESSVHTH